MIKIKPLPFTFFNRWLPSPLDASCDGDVYLGRDLHAFDGKRLKRLTQMTRVILALAFLFTLFSFRWRRIEIIFDGRWTEISIMIAALAIWLLCDYTRQNTMLTAAAALVAESLMTPLLTLFTYAAASFGGADQTALIVSLDTWLGFDWLMYFHSVQSMRFANRLLKEAYFSFEKQYLFLPLLLLICGYAGHARLLMNCFIIGIIVVMSVAVLLPTVDAMLWTKFYPANTEGYTGFVHIDHWLKLRDGSLTSLSVTEITGIICFPSFHTVAACLFAGFSAPLGPARFIVIALNAAMIAATPRWGGHYLLDVLAGVVIGVGLIAAALAYTRRRPGPGKIHSLP